MSKGKDGVEIGYVAGQANTIDGAMNKLELQNNVIRIVANQLQSNINEVKLESTLAEDLAADSLDEVELVMEFEEEYKIDIDDESAEKIKTVKDIVDVIEKLTGGNE